MTMLLEAQAPVQAPWWVTLFAGAGIGGFVGALAALVNGWRQREHETKTRAQTHRDDVDLKSRDHKHDLDLKRQEEAERQRDTKVDRLRDGFKTLAEGLFAVRELVNLTSQASADVVRRQSLETLRENAYTKARLALVLDSEGRTIVDDFESIRNLTREHGRLVQDGLSQVAAGQLSQADHRAEVTESQAKIETAIKDVLKRMEDTLIKVSSPT